MDANYVKAVEQCNRVLRELRQQPEPNHDVLVLWMNTRRKLVLAMQREELRHDA